jgi:hypothetical protein
VFPEFSNAVSVPAGKGFTFMVTALNTAEQVEALETVTVMISPSAIPATLLATLLVPFWITAPFFLKIYFVNPGAAVKSTRSPAQIGFAEAVSVPAGSAITVIFGEVNVVLQLLPLVTTTVR